MSTVNDLKSNPRSQTWSEFMAARKKASVSKEKRYPWCAFSPVSRRTSSQPVALERPANPAAEAKPAFEEVQGILNVGPDDELVILKKILRVSIERGTIGRAVTVRLAVPDCVGVLLVES